MRNVNNKLVTDKRKKEAQAVLVRDIREGKLAGLTLPDLHKLLDDMEERENAKCH